jgi:hypothetical protein
MKSERSVDRHALLFIWALRVVLERKDGKPNDEALTRR